MLLVYRNLPGAGLSIQSLVPSQLLTIEEARHQILGHVVLDEQMVHTTMQIEFHKNSMMTRCKRLGPTFCAASYPSRILRHLLVNKSLSFLWLLISLSYNPQLDFESSAPSRITTALLLPPFKHSPCTPRSSSQSLLSSSSAPIACLSLSFTRRQL